jgi:hypothetical protein
MSRKWVTRVDPLPGKARNRDWDQEKPGLPSGMSRSWATPSSRPQEETPPSSPCVEEETHPLRGRALPSSDGRSTESLAGGSAPSTSAARRGSATSTNLHDRTMPVSVAGLRSTPVRRGATARGSHRSAFSAGRAPRRRRLASRPGIGCVLLVRNRALRQA